MTVAFLNVFLLSLLFSWIGQTAPSRSLNVWNRPKPNIIGFVAASAVMILFTGLRNNIGDTFYYIHSFKLMVEAGNPVPNLNTNNFLFAYFQHVIAKLGGDKTAFIMISILLTYIPFMLFLRKYSYDFTLAVFFFFSIGICYTTMNGIRQFIAVGIIVLGSKFLFSPKKYQFLFLLILIIIAYYFHTSSLFFIPLYFICRRKAWSPSTFMIILAALAALLFVSMFLPSFLNILEDSSFSQYSTNNWFRENGEGGVHILRVVFHAIPMVLSAVYYKELREHGPIIDILINISVVHFAIFIVALYNWIFARFAFYTYIYTVVLLSIIFSTVLKKPERKGLKIALFVAYIFFFFEDSAGIHFYASDFFIPNNTILF